MTASGHAFVGPGKICNATLLSGVGTAERLRVYDTDRGNTDDLSNVVLELNNTAANETVDPAGVPVWCHRGAYVQLSGDSPRAVLETIPSALSDGAVRSLAQRTRFKKATV